MENEIEASTKVARLNHIYDLCDAIAAPGASIPANADTTLADTLLQRDSDTVALCRAAVSILVANPQVHHFLECAWADDIDALDRFLADGTLVAFLNTPLMQALLTTTPIPYLSFEKLFAHIRKRFLESVSNPEWKYTDIILKAGVAISIYAYLTEYVFSESDAETALINGLQLSLESGSRPHDILAIAVLGAYRPLSEMSLCRTLVENGAENPLAKDMIRIQVLEPDKERELAADMPALTQIDDSASTRVRAQYEENPYPRWVSHIYNPKVSSNDYFRKYCPGVDLGEYGDPARSNVLVAGCGTGRTAIEDGFLWRDADILAVDLSLASLGYGMRRAQELGIKNLSFVQGDILELPGAGKVFDYISCTGVLHHMADPIAGFRALRDVCRPGGVVRISLYSASAREPVRRVRDLIGPGRDKADSNSIRAIRQGLIAQVAEKNDPEGALEHVFARLDMYTTSMCRDLLFHVQEQDFTIPKIAEAVNRLELKFCGFVDSSQRLLASYRAFAPEDSSCLDLDSWDRFEAENPQIFLGMYDFMVQKPL